MESIDHLRLARAEAVARKQRAESEEGLMESLTAATEAGDAETAAEVARKIRNRMLTESDKVMLLDMSGIALPDKITATTLLSAVKDLFDVLRDTLNGEWAHYRQQLRDLPEQPGFPFGIEWPDSPEKADRDEQP